MTEKELVRLLLRKGCETLRQTGARVVVRCGECQTTVPLHGARDLSPGLMKTIERQLERCLGEGWLREDDPRGGQNGRKRVAGPADGR